VNPDAPFASPDGDHSVPGTFFEVFGNADQVIDPPPMNGFVAQQEKNEPGTGAQVLSCFNHSSVPIISTLAQEFAIFDRWYSSVPGPTFVNRLYSVSGTSDGSSDNSNRRIIDGYPQRPLFVNLEEAGISWEIFFEQISFALGFSQMRAPKMLRHFSLFEDFIAKAKNGTLPQFTYLEPRYYPMFGGPCVRLSLSLTRTLSRSLVCNAPAPHVAAVESDARTCTQTCRPQTSIPRTS
jgi:phospholipase C